MGRQWSSGTSRRAGTGKAGPVPVPAVKRKPNVNRMTRSRYATDERAPGPGCPVRNAPDRRIFTLVGRPDREVICAQVIRLWAPPPGSHGPRCVLRTRRRTLTVGEELYVRWAALTCSL